jgi:hypothetical protein
MNPRPIDLTFSPMNEDLPQEDWNDILIAVNEMQRQAKEQSMAQADTNQQSCSSDIRMLDQQSSPSSPTECSNLFLEIHLKQKRHAPPLVPIFSVPASKATSIREVLDAIASQGPFIEDDTSLTYLPRLFKIEGYMPESSRRSPSAVIFKVMCRGERMEGKNADKDWNDYMEFCTGYFERVGACGRVQEEGDEEMRTRVALFFC